MSKVSGAWPLIDRIAAAPGLPVLHAIVEPDIEVDGLPGGALSNPTRSLLLADPAGGEVVYGCVIDDMDDNGEIAGGIRASARLLFWGRASVSARTGAALVCGRII